MCGWVGGRLRACAQLGLHLCSSACVDVCVCAHVFACLPALFASCVALRVAWVFGLAAASGYMCVYVHGNGVVPLLVSTVSDAHILK